ncbi:hypothetical protein Efla_007894 [Eimeria flavescens]
MLPAPPAELRFEWLRLVPGLTMMHPQATGSALQWSSAPHCIGSTNVQGSGRLSGGGRRPAVGLRLRAHDMYKIAALVNMLGGKIIGSAHVLETALCSIVGETVEDDECSHWRFQNQFLLMLQAAWVDTQADRLSSAKYVFDAFSFVPVH